MGMYTEFHYNVELNKDVPVEVIEILKFMVDDPVIESSYEALKHRERTQAILNNYPEYTKHPLFSTDRWHWMLSCDSYYFKADTNSTLRKDDIADSYYLCIRCSLKNYGNEIQKFIDWISPYVDSYENELLGFYRYEEDILPTLIYYPNCSLRILATETKTP